MRHLHVITSFCAIGAYLCDSRIRMDYDGMDFTN